MSKNLDGYNRVDFAIARVEYKVRSSLQSIAASISATVEATVLLHVID